LKAHYTKLFNERAAQGQRIVNDWYELIEELPPYELGGKEYVAELHGINPVYTGSTPDGVELWIRDVPVDGEKLRPWLPDNYFLSHYNKGIKVMFRGDVSQTEEWLKEHYDELHSIMSSCALRGVYDSNYLTGTSETACDNDFWVQWASR